MEHFNASGHRSLDEIERTLGGIGKSLEDSARALDFGCGCGRILRWLEPVSRGTELYGVDIDPEAIAWTQEHLPFAKTSVNQPLPPLDFPEAHFDLIYNHSVFTHIDESFQDAWLAELRRVTMPGGAVVLTVMGDHAFEGYERSCREAGVDPSPIRERFEELGILYIEEDSWKGGPFPDFYHSTFHKPWYVFEHWGQYLDLRAYVVRGSLGYQDTVMLTRPPRPPRP